ncbi:MAG TPA: hypothetical protein PK992_01115, partial [Planctomycetaceae bacterium]|nr:hypothetical protein [Planctomycetaceae bacterium]
DAVYNVAGRNFPATQSRKQSANVVQFTEEPKSKSPLPDTVNRDVHIAILDVDDSSRHHVRSREPLDEIPLAIRPLSAVARHQWNQMVRAEPPVATSPSGVERVSAGNTWPQLRSCPATEAIINSLL